MRVDRLLGHRATRRQAIARAGAAGAVAAMGGFASSAGSARAADGEAGSTIVVPADLRTDLAGQSITVTLAHEGGLADWERAAVAKFAAATGIEVTRKSGPRLSVDRLAAYLDVLNAGGSDIDAMMVDAVTVGALAPHALDLGDAMRRNGSVYSPVLVANNTASVDGTALLAAIPWYADAGQLFYRTDLLRKYGYPNPPATWDELQTMASTIQRGERAAGNKGFWGYVWQGNGYEGLTCNALEWQVSNGGGAIIEPDRSVTVDNPAAAAAFQRASQWVGTISPDGVVAFQEEEGRGIWQHGDAAFIRTWSYNYWTSQADGSPIRGLFAQTTLPKGDGVGARNASCIGGWQMLASRYSKHPEAAVEFCRYLTAEALQRSLAIEQSPPPTIAALYDDPTVIAANPHFPQLKAVMADAVMRPSTIAAGVYPDVSAAYFTAVHQLLTNDRLSFQALSGLASQLNILLAQNGSR